MRRDWRLKRGRWLPLLGAGMVGYVLGGWHTAPSRPDDLSASQNVALRFAEAKADTTAVDAADLPPDAAASTIALKQARLALLSPQPMVPVTVPRPPAERQQAVAALPPAMTVPAPAVAAPRPEAKPIALAPRTISFIRSMEVLRPT